MTPLSRPLRYPSGNASISVNNGHLASVYVRIPSTRYCNQPVEEDSSLVTVLRNAGGIPLCKTNVPQTMLAFECSNPVFGRTLNPYSPNHTCGGSSGGEAALIALDGSPLGIGVSRQDSLSRSRRRRHLIALPV